MGVHFVAPIIVALTTLLGLTGCQTLVRQSERGPWTTIPLGSTLTLNRPIPVSKDRARVFFVNGRLRNVGASFLPACALEVRTISRDGPQIIQAGPFRIVRVQDYWTEVVRRDDLRTIQVRLASHDRGDGGHALIQTGYHFWLESTASPGVMRLTCLGLLADPWEAYPPTIQEIRHALGPLATLEIIEHD